MPFFLHFASDFEIKTLLQISSKFVFIFGEALPLFRPAQGEAKGIVSLASVPPAESIPPSTATVLPAATTALEKPLAIGIDEYQMYFYEVLADGRTAFFKTSDRTLLSYLFKPLTDHWQKSFSGR